MPLAAHARVALGRLHLDDLGAPVGELAHRGRAGAHPRQIDHLEAGEGALGLDIHCCFILSGLRFVPETMAWIADTVEFAAKCNHFGCRTFVMDHLDEPGSSWAWPCRGAIDAGCSRPRPEFWSGQRSAGEGELPYWTGSDGVLRDG